MKPQNQTKATTKTTTKPLKPLKPQKPKVKVQKVECYWKTKCRECIFYVLLALAGIGGAYIAKEKDNE